MLAGLGIGVYAADGRRLLAGSETKDEDFFLYDFDVPALAEMAAAPVESFYDLHAVLARAGYSGSSAELVAEFSSAFDARQDAFLPRLFAALGVSPDQPLLTPLESWLLLLSGAPPNGSNETGMITAALAGPGVARCNGIVTGSGIEPNWTIGDQPWVEDMQFKAAAEMYYALQGPPLARALAGRLESDPPFVHEGHDGEAGEASELHLRPQIDFSPVNVAMWSCGTLINTIHPLGEPLASYPVNWVIDGDLQTHGSLGPEVTTLSDERGVASVTYTADGEAPGSDGPEQSLTGDISAELPAHDVFRSFLGITDPGLLTFVPERLTVSGYLTVRWHEPEETPAPSAPETPLAVGDPCALITQEEAAREAGQQVRPGFQSPTEIEGLGVGAACIFRNADVPEGEFGTAHIRIDVVDLGAGGGEKFAAAGLAISDGHVPDLGDDNFYFCAETCGPATLVFRRANLAVLVHDLTADGLAGATRLAALALQRIDAP